MRLRHVLVGAALLAPASAHAALVIKAAPTSNVTCAGDTCTATAADATLNIKTLKTMLKRGNADVVSGSLAGDIEIGTALPWTSNATLTLDAYHSIRIARAVTVESTGGLTLITNDGGMGGDLSFPEYGHVNFWDLTSALTIDGHAYTLVGDIATLATDINANHYDGYYALAANYDAGPDGSYAAPPVYQVNDVFEGLGNSISNLTMYNGTSGTWTGLIRYIKGAVRNVALLNVAITGYADGGAVGYENDGTISRVSSTGSIHVSDGGGLTFYNKGAIVFSHSNAAVSGTGFVGGLVADNTEFGTITQSFATGTIFTGGSAGGLVSINDGAITASYSRGDVSGGTGVYSGGFIAMNYSENPIAQAYETGAVTGGGRFGGAGGFIGQNGICPVSAAYWDQTTTGMSGKTNGTGDHKHTTGITPTTSAKLKAALLDGFDPALWGLDHAINGGFPYLLNNPR